MSDAPVTSHATSDGLGRWLLGGLVTGGILLGLLIAAYVVGYHRGQHHAAKAATAPPAATTPAATATTTTTAPGSTKTATTLGPVALTPALVARGKTLYSSDGCSGCHSLNGAAGAGPTFKGLAGSTVTLSTGQTVTADDAYLERSITDPDAEIVKGFHPGLMGPAIASHQLARNPADLRALVAFVKSQK